MSTRKKNHEKKTKPDLTRLFEVLDERSRSILWYLWWHRHARISELGRFINAANDYEVMVRLKEVINGKAQELWSQPAVSFEESKTDPLTGEKVTFSWWLLCGEDFSVTGKGKRLVDVFDEKDGITIVAQIPGCDSPADKKADCKSSPPEVKVKQVRCKNGIVQISLEKGEK